MLKLFPELLFRCSAFLTGTFFRVLTILTVRFLVSFFRRSMGSRGKNHFVHFWWTHPDWWFVGSTACCFFWCTLHFYLFCPLLDIFELSYIRFWLQHCISENGRSVLWPNISSCKCWGTGLVLVSGCRLSDYVFRGIFSWCVEWVKFNVWYRVFCFI